MKGGTGAAREDPMPNSRCVPPSEHDEFTGECPDCGGELDTWGKCPACEKEARDDFRFQEWKDGEAGRWEDWV